MAKTRKKNSREPISTAKIYETIKAREFLQDLWWDLISDIKEKPTYKRIKEMVKALIDDSIDDISTAPKDKQKSLDRRTMLTELSIMTYTIDTVITGVLFRKLQNEFQLIIANMIEELQAERSATPGPSNEHIESTFEAKNQKDSRTMSPNVRLIKTSPLSLPSTPEMTPPSARRGRPKKNAFVGKSISSVPSSSTPLPRKTGQSLNPSKRISRAVSRIKSPTREITNNDLTCFSPNGIKTEIEDFDQVSDAETEGSLSMTSVSSVHTSELSSFEDTISIDGEEEGGQTKKIPLKLANDMYLQGTLSQIYEFGKRTEKHKMALQSFESPGSKSLKQSRSAESSPLMRKVLPQRVRKPNSKYNSETMICEVYPPVGVFSMSPKLNNNSSFPSPPRQKRRRISSSDNKSEKSLSTDSSPIRCHSNVNSVNKSNPVTKCSPTRNHLSPSTSSSKKYKSSDLNKRHPAVGNVSRGSPAITLFSTLNK